MSHNKIKSKLKSILTGKEENERCLNRRVHYPRTSEGVWLRGKIKVEYKKDVGAKNNLCWLQNQREIGR